MHLEHSLVTLDIATACLQKQFRFQDELFIQNKLVNHGLFWERVLLVTNTDFVKNDENLATVIDNRTELICFHPSCDIICPNDILTNVLSIRALFWYTVTFSHPMRMLERSQI